LDEYLGTKMSVRAFRTLIAEQSEAIVAYGVGHPIRLYILPVVKWRDIVGKVYGTGAWLEQSKHMNIRSLQEAMTEIVTEQVDAEWKPNAFGVIYDMGVPSAFIVPVNYPWIKIVEGSDG